MNCPNTFTRSPLRPHMLLVKHPNKYTARKRALQPIAICPHLFPSVCAPSALLQVPEEDIVSVTDMLQHQRKEAPTS